MMNKSSYYVVPDSQESQIGIDQRMYSFMINISGTKIAAVLYAVCSGQHQEMSEICFLRSGDGTYLNSTN
jgi:hypothetical protein